MKKIWISLVVTIWVFAATAPSAFAQVVVGPFAENILDDQTYTGQDYDYQAKASRGGGGGYRSAPGTYHGAPGAGVGAAPGGAGYRTGPRAPSAGVTRPAPGAGTTAPTTGAGRFGSFFGGMAAGAILGHLLNPFGGWGAGGFGGGLFPIISILFWGVLIYLTYRLVKWLFRGKVR